VELANPASCLLFGQSQAKLRNHPVAQLIADFNVQRWLESSPQETHAEHVVVNGQNYLLEVTPVYLEGEHNERVLTGAVAMLLNRAHGTPAADHDQPGHQRLQSDPRGGAENAPRGGASAQAGDAQRAAADCRRHRHR
jgi:transcriptional regulator of aromatic amino acid metabolism